MFCTRCGHELPPDAKFCTACGAKVKAAGEAEKPKPTAVSAQKQTGEKQSGGVKELFQIIVALGGIILCGLVLLIMIQGILSALF